MTERALSLLTFVLMVGVFQAIDAVRCQCPAQPTPRDSGDRTIDLVNRK